MDGHSDGHAHLDVDGDGDTDLDSLRNANSDGYRSPTA